MTRKFVQRFVPDHDTFRKHPSLQPLGILVHDPNLWHLNRRSVSRAFLIGIFTAMLPMPGQMALVALLSLVVHANLPIAILLVWITNPVTMPVIFYGTYKLGALLLQRPPGHFSIQLSLDWVMHGLLPIWQPLLTGCLLVGIVGGLLGFGIVRLLWRINVIRHWNIRAQKRLKRRLREYQDSLQAQTGDQQPRTGP